MITAPVGQVGAGFTTQSAVWRSAQGTFARILPRKVDPGQAWSTGTLGAGQPPRLAALREVAMTEDNQPARAPLNWWGMVQVAVGTEPIPDWGMCCAVTLTGDDPAALAAPLLAAHPDADNRRHRVVLWANEERTGPVWRISHTSASRFNPNTGETTTMEPLPFSPVPQDNPTVPPAAVTPEGEVQWRKSENATAAGLRWASAADKARNQPWPQPVVLQGEDAAAAAFRASFETAKESVDPSEDQGPQGIPVDYQPAVVKTARVLNEAVMSASEYVRTHHEGLEWSNVEECLAPVAAAASAFVAAYTMWRLSE